MFFCMCILTHSHTIMSENLSSFFFVYIKPFPSCLVFFFAFFYSSWCLLPSTDFSSSDCSVKIKNKVCVMGIVQMGEYESEKSIRLINRAAPHYSANARSIILRAFLWTDLYNPRRRRVFLYIYILWHVSEWGRGWWLLLLRQMQFVSKFRTK